MVHRSAGQRQLVKVPTGSRLWMFSFLLLTQFLHKETGDRRRWRWVQHHLKLCRGWTCNQTQKVVFTQKHSETFPLTFPLLNFPLDVSNPTSFVIFSRFTNCYRKVLIESSWFYPQTDKVGRPISTVIYFLLLTGSVSHLHRLPSAETWHFYMGEPLTVITSIIFSNRFDL